MMIVIIIIIILLYLFSSNNKVRKKNKIKTKIKFNFGKFFLKFKLFRRHLVAENGNENLKFFFIHLKFINSVQFIFEFWHSSS